MSRHQPELENASVRLHGRRPVQAHAIVCSSGRTPAKDPANLAWREVAIDLTFLASIATRRWQEPTMEHEQHRNQSNTITK
jgi:hypothetical protein